MGWKRIVGALAVVGGAVACGGLIPGVTQQNTGGTITMNFSNQQGVSLTSASYEAKTVTGNYNAAQRQTSDAGWTILTGTPNPLDNDAQKCRGIGVGFPGRPTAGTTFTLALLSNPDGGPLLGPDGGHADLTGLATVNYEEGCVQANAFQQWIANAGTLTIDAVNDPPPATALGGSKQVKFHVSGAQMGVFAGNAAGTFTLDATGTVDNVTGMQ